MPCVDAYLRRIGLLAADKPFDPADFPANLATLRRLQQAHLTHVPYETLDIVMGRPFGLDVDEVYDKVVMRGRGGYCFELNGLFAWLLRELGYPVTEYFARFLRDADPGVPRRRHRVLRVGTPEGEYLCDVGVGGILPLHPLHLCPDEVQQDPNGLYRFVKDDFYGWIIEEFRHDTWSAYYAFTEEVQLPQDFDYANFHCQLSPESPFRQHAICCLQTLGGRKTLREGEFRIFTENGVETRVPRDDAEYRSLLRELFGIVV